MEPFPCKRGLIFLPNVSIHICGDPRYAMTPSLGRERRKSGTGLDSLFSYVFISFHSLCTVTPSAKAAFQGAVKNFTI